MLLSGSDILVKTLIEQGCDTVFGYPGGQILNVYDSLYNHQDEINHVLTAHEQGATHAADGYARTTGKVGVVISTSGPGATNLVTGIATAYLDSVPMVAICGNVPTGQIGTDSFQEIDITGITLPITKHNYFVGKVEDLADTIREAFKLAKSGRPGPVLIDVPKDVQVAKCDYTQQPPVVKDEAFAAKELRIQEAAKYINACKKPLIYFGGGLITSEAQDEMLELADKIDAPIGCSLMGLSAIPTDHPRFLGMQGMHGHFASSMAMHNADLIISLGVRFNDRVTGNRQKFARGAKIVHIDVDGSELCKTVNAACGLRGDVKLTLQQLLPLINKSEKPEWAAKVNALKEEEESYLDNREGLTPRRAIMTLNKYLGENTAVCTDVGQHQMWSAQNLVFKKPRRFASSGGLGTMGYGFGAAIGAAYGTGERSVLVTGDGSFVMNMNELTTAVRYHIPVVILLLNNGVLGMVRPCPTLLYDKHYSNSVLDNKMDFAAFAKAVGADGVTVDTPEDLDAALKTAFTAEGPYVINCMIGKDEFVLPMLPPNGSMDDIITKLEVEL
ncbi:MAG: biosynthetic-type acetolactate synthase large subunit [Clostridia bacterium]|nr:biosynthetic-type acetolactate synthase large subunit [Clostridia bacterium]